MERKNMSKNYKVTHLIRLTNIIYECTQVYIDKRLKNFNLTKGTYPLACIKQISWYKPMELNVGQSMSAITIRLLIELVYIRKKENLDDIRAYKLYN
jgi:hypothetical protein